MKLSRAREIVREQFIKHGLHATGWEFKFNNAKRQYGYCDSRNRCISLSKPLTLLNDEARVTNTILHEIAHALVGCIHGHDRVWKAQAQVVGCTGERCVTEHEGLGVVSIKRPYIATCPTCKKVIAERFRIKTSVRHGFHRGCTNSLGGTEQIIWTKRKP